MIIFRCISALVILIAALFVSPWLALPLALAHAYLWRAYELAVIGVMIDAYFGVVAFVPYYTLAAFFILTVAAWIKPHLSLHSHVS